MGYLPVNGAFGAPARVGRLIVASADAHRPPGRESTPPGEDRLPTADVVEMFELLPNAQLAVLPGTTHVGVTRRSSEVLALITPFLGAR